MSEPLIDTHSTMGAREYRRVAGMPEPPEGVGLRLTFTVMCPDGMEGDAKETVTSALDALGLHDRHYRRERVRP